MQVFHVLVFDDALEDTTSVYIAPKFNADLAAADKLQIMGVATQISGTTPTLTVQVEHSPDNRHFVPKSRTAEIDAASLASPPVLVSGNDPGTVPSGGFVRLRIALGGTSPKARLRLWVTGRSF